MVIVLDTSSLFILEHLPQGVRLYAPPGVRYELEKYGDSRLPYLNEMIQFVSPGKQSIEKVREAARLTGDDIRLSQVDMEVLALALELKATIITDDYSIQNLAARMGIDYKGVGKVGIRKVIRWRYKCSGCGRTYSDFHPECPVCGSALRSYMRRK